MSSISYIYIYICLYVLCVEPVLESQFAALFAVEMKKHEEHFDRQISELKAEVEGYKTEVSKLRDELEHVRNELNNAKNDESRTTAAINDAIEFFKKIESNPQISRNVALKQAVTQMYEIFHSCKDGGNVVNALKVLTEHVKLLVEEVSQLLTEEETTMALVRAQPKDPNASENSAAASVDDESMQMRRDLVETHKLFLDKMENMKCREDLEPLFEKLRTVQENYEKLCQHRQLPDASTSPSLQSCSTGQQTDVSTAMQSF